LQAASNLGEGKQNKRFVGHVSVQWVQRVAKKFRVQTAVMASETSSDYERETHSDIASGEQAPRRPRSGRHVRDEPNTLIELQACPLAMSCFQHLASFKFC